LALGLLHQLLEDVVEPFVLEVALLLGDPFLQPEVRLDDELLLAHAFLLGWIEISSSSGLFASPASARRRGGRGSSSRGRPSTGARRRHRASRSPRRAPCARRESR